MQDESAELETPARIPTEPSHNIKELREEIEAEKSEGRIEKAVATCQRVNDRLRKCQKHIDKYEDTEVRGAKDVTNNV